MNHERLILELLEAMQDRLELLDEKCGDIIEKLDDQRAMLAAADVSRSFDPMKPRTKNAEDLKPGDYIIVDEKQLLIHAVTLNPDTPHVGVKVTLNCEATWLSFPRYWTKVEVV